MAHRDPKNGTRMFLSNWNILFGRDVILRQHFVVTWFK
jgi:hypothetical protein